MTRLLFFLLCVSTGINIYLIFFKSSNSVLPINDTEFVNPITLDDKKYSPPIKESLSDSEKVDKTNKQPGSQENNIEVLKKQLAEKEYETLEFALREFLASHPNHQEALLLEAEFFLNTKTLNYALTHYYELLTKALSTENEAKIRLIIQQQTTNVIQQLTGDGSWEILASFLEPLIQVDPINQQYVLALARAYGMLKQDSLMENVLAALDNRHPRAIRLRKEVEQRLMQENTNKRALGDPEVSISSSDDMSPSPDVIARLTNRNQLFVNMIINGNNVNMLLDTGATTTAMKQSVLDSFPNSIKQFVGYFNVQTAGGLINTPLYKVSSIELGKQRFNDITVLSLPNESSGDFSGLLGMNILKHYKMEFDTERQQMTLTNRYTN